MRGGRQHRPFIDSQSQILDVNAEEFKAESPDKASMQRSSVNAQINVNMSTLAIILETAKIKMSNQRYEMHWRIIK